MTTLLLRNAHLLATFDDSDRTFEDGGIFVRDGVIEYVGPSAGLPSRADDTIDATGMVVLPGLVNTHHHFFQTLTRNLPVAQDAPLFPWLVAHYPIWGRITADGVRSATAIAISELILSGCTTAADHGYIWKNGARLDDQIDVARQMGFRFHASRGSMSIGQSKGGLPPDALVEDEDAILRDCVRVIDAYHDPARVAMTRIVVAPCSPFSVSTDLMRQSAELARARGLTLHTHLCETHDEEAYCLEHFGKRPIALAATLDWTGPDVWYAHGIVMNDDEIEL
jgi:cytosine/adenosine deaminase-related metal-dependent hydrolase